MALGYYLSSLPTLLRGFQDRVRTTFAFLAGRRPFTLTLRDGTRFLIRSAMDAWTVKETCLDAAYERACTRIQSDWTIVDVGAAFGDFAVSVARAHPRARVYAYEPFPESFALLCRNIALNQVSNVVPLQRGVSGAGGTLVLSLTGAAVQHSAYAEAADDPARQITIESVSLEQMLADIPACDFLKIDCEGAEFDILLNASPFALAKIRNIALEYHDGFTPHTHQQLADFLRSHGFTVDCFPNPVHAHLGLMSARRLTAAAATPGPA
jgi:FkbM family methyltransferase